MTAINNHLTLIDQVGGIEKAKAIVEGAPEWASSYCKDSSEYYSVHDDFECCYNLSNLRTAIAQHEQGSNSSEFKVGDLVVLIQFANDFAREHDALYDLFDFENDLETLAVLSDRKGGEVRSSTQHLRHATLAEFKAGHRLDAN